MISRKFKSLLEHDSKHGLGLFWRIFSQNRWDCCSSCTKKWEFLLNLFGTDWVLNGFKNFDIVSYIVLSCLGIEHLQLFLFGWSHWNQVQWTFETCKDPGPRTAIGQGPWTGAVISCNQWDWDIFRPPLHSPYFIYNYIYISLFLIIIDIIFILLIYCFSNFCSCPHMDSGMPCISYPCGAQKSASHKLTPNPSRPRENPSECAAPSTPCDSQVRMDVVVTKVAIYKEIVQQIPGLPHKAVAEVSKIGNL